jgi:hypothetical protein
MSVYKVVISAGILFATKDESWTKAFKAFSQARYQFRKNKLKAEASSHVIASPKSNVQPQEELDNDENLNNE